jgi:hypothetical protein
MYSSIFPSHCLAILFTGMLIVLICTSDMCLELFDVGWWSPEENMAVGREWELQVSLSPSSMGLLSASSVLYCYEIEI